MTNSAAPPYKRYQARNRTSRIRVAVPAIVVFAVVLWGGYVEHWSWTGINRHTATLWDWLHLLLLPAVLAILPLWMSRKTRLTERHKRWSLIAFSVFAAIVLLGYVVPWAWTGFSGNTLWDWLGLIALPIAVALAPVYDELRRTWSRRHTRIVVGLLGTFALVILGGYLAKWSWTGFHNNTIWDWLRLLLLPLLIPTVVVPALKPLAMAGVTVMGESRAEGEQPSAETEDRPEHARVGADG